MEQRVTFIESKRTSRLTVLILLLAFFGVAGVSGQQPSIFPPGLTVRNGKLLKGGEPYRGVGANYFDLFLRVLAQPTNTTSLDGLEKLGRAGIPFVRFATMFTAEDLKFYQDRREDYFRRLDLVVRAAERCNIGLIPSLNWTFEMAEVAQEPRDQWGNPQSQTILLMREYVGGLVDRYKHSRALWGWEFGNEPALQGDLPNASQFRRKGGTERDDLTSAQIATALTEFGKEVRRHDSTRPVFSGNSHPRFCAWHNTAEKSWLADSREQFEQVLRRDNPVPMDTICVHLYGNAVVQKEMGAWATNRIDWLATVKSIARETRRPLFVGEFGLPGRDNEIATRATFSELLTQMEEAGVDLAAFWVYDLGSQSENWSVQLENSRAFMISLTAEANRRWNQRAQKIRQP